MPPPSPTPRPTPTGPLLDPFTGEPVKSLGPVLAVKIDNIVYARPQTGLQSADLVYVIPVEGGLTRFMAVYSSHIPPVVGPVRSARQSDLDILRQFGRPAFAWSGATPHLVPFIERAPVVDLYALQVGGYYRSQSRVAPYNLYANTKQLMAEAKGASKARDIGFRFGPVPASAVAARVKGTASYSVKYPAASYTFRWSAKDKRWLTWIDGAPADGHRGRAARRAHGDHPVHADLDVALRGVRRPAAVRQVDRLGAGGHPARRQGVHRPLVPPDAGRRHHLHPPERPADAVFVLAPDSHASYVNASKV